MIQSTDELLGQLHGVTGPEVMPPATEPPFLMWLAVAAITVITAAVFFRWWRRPTMPLDPLTEARRSLESLSEQPSPDELDRLVRRYLSRSRNIQVEQRASTELRAVLPPDDEPWIALLEANDYDRFAGAAPAQPAYLERLRRAAMLLQAEVSDPAGR